MIRFSLSINHRSFGQAELTEYSEWKTTDVNTPPWEKEVYQFIHDWLEDSPAVVQYSSGTTGRSKKVFLSKQSMIRSAENTCRYFNLTRGQTALLCLPAKYIAGKMMVVRSIVGGLDLQLIEPRSRPDLSGTGTIDFCAMVPLQVLNSIHSAGGFPSIHKLIIGGAEISTELESQLKKVSVDAYATYGMSETCSHIAIRRINGAQPEPYYQAMPGVELETDERSCLVIKADYLPGPVITNDRVQLEGTGKFLWLGRYDNLINSGGIKIVPEDVESVIADKTGLACALIGIPDIKLRQSLVFIAEKKRINAPDSLILSELQKLLPPKLLPGKIIWVNKLPRNKAMKLDRRKLAKLVYPML
jgi:o-succinylbenzoate---CoA ligase